LLPQPLLPTQSRSASPNRAYVTVNGRIQMSGKSADLLGNEAVRKAYLGLN